MTANSQAPTKLLTHNTNRNMINNSNNSIVHIKITSICQCCDTKITNLVLQDQITGHLRVALFCSTCVAKINGTHAQCFDCGSTEVYAYPDRFVADELCLDCFNKEYN